jgi:hypothetical protein
MKKAARLTYRCAFPRLTVLTRSVAYTSRYSSMTLKSKTAASMISNFVR